jgi:hypothetical protein
MAAELGYIGFIDPRRNVGDARTGATHLDVQETSRDLVSAKKSDANEPIRRSFTYSDGEGTRSLLYHPHPEADLLTHSENGLTRQAFLNGTFLEIGVQTPEGKGTSVRYSKTDGAMLQPPQLDASVFSGISFDIRVSPDNLALLGNFFGSLRGLATPPAEDFQRVVSIMRQTFPTSHQPQLL